MNKINWKIEQKEVAAVENPAKRKHGKRLFGAALLFFGIIFVLILSAVKPSAPPKNYSDNNKKEIKMLWDIPTLMNKSHNQIVKILGNPTAIHKLSDGKAERFRFVDNQMQRFYAEDVPARRGMRITEYDVFYKQSDCEMMVCGNDLTYSYIDPDQPVKYFFIGNYPVENPALSVAELKQIGNLNSTTTIKVIPFYSKWPRGMVLIGLDICEKNYRGSEYEVGSENCSK